MVDVRRRFELYVALTKILRPELASYLVERLTEVERNPGYQRHNRERFEANPDAFYNLYRVMRAHIGEVHTMTLFEMLDPLEWGRHGATSEELAVAGAGEGSDHGG